MSERIEDGTWSGNSMGKVVNIKRRLFEMPLL